MIQRTLRLGSVLLVSMLLLAACGGSGGTGDTTTPTPEPTAGDVIARASTTIANAKSIHFNLKIKGDSYVDPAHTIRLLNAQGDLLRPDKVDVTFQVNLFGASNATIRMITIGDHSWTTDILSGKWGPAPEEFGYNPSVLFDTKNGLGPVIGKLHGVKLEGTEEIGGRTAYKISGVASQDDISVLTAESMSGSSFPVQLWIDTNSSQLLQIVLAEPEDSGKDHPATWTMRISGYDEDVSIESPV
ncbi:MAG: LppX_LprAFG lipoprotein [Thermomicrobiales bacterium]